MSTPTAWLFPFLPKDSQKSNPGTKWAFYKPGSGRVFLYLPPVHSTRCSPVHLHPDLGDERVFAATQIVRVDKNHVGLNPQLVAGRVPVERDGGVLFTTAKHVQVRQVQGSRSGLDRLRRRVGEELEEDTRAHLIEDLPEVVPAVSRPSSKPIG